MRAAEQTRARYPDADGLHRARRRPGALGAYGSGAPPAYLLLPTWEALHSRTWKCQIPFLARYGTVITFDPRGNGRSDRPRNAALYAGASTPRTPLAVLDAAGERAVVVVASCGLGESLILAAEHPERVAGLVVIAPAVRLADMHRNRLAYTFDDPLHDRRGLGQGEPPLLAARLARIPSSSSSASASASRTRRSRSRTRSTGRSRPTPRPCSLRFRGWNDRDRARGGDGTRRADRVPGLVSMAPRIGSCRPRRGRTLAEADRRGARQPRRLGPRPARPRPCAHEPAASDSPGARWPPSRRCRHWTRAVAPAEAGPLHLLADRARPRAGATSRSPTSCASSTPTSRSTGWPRIR